MSSCFSPMLDSLRKFQVARAKEHDSKCYTVADIKEN